jgi:hypothetical protein
MLKRLAYNTSMRTLNAWKHYLHELKRHQHLVKQSVLRLKERAQLAAFSGWYQVWTRKKHNRVVLDRAATKLANRDMAVAFEGCATNVLRCFARRFLQRASPKTYTAACASVCACRIV